MANWIQEYTKEQNAKATNEYITKKKLAEQTKNANWIERSKAEIEQKNAKIRIANKTSEASNDVNNYVNSGNSDIKQAAKIIYNARISGVSNDNLSNMTMRLAKNDINLANKIWDYRDEDATWGDKAATVGSSFLEGLKDAGEGIATTFGFGDDSWQKPSFEQDQINKNKESMGDLGDFFADAAYGIGNTIPSIAVSLANPWAGAAVAFTSQYGQSYNQAIGEGKDESEAVTYAFLNGATSAVLEKALGVVGGSKLAQSVAGKLVKDEAVKSALGKFLVRTGASAAGEFTEETLESLLQPIIYNISTSGEDQKLDGDYVLNAFRDGLIGGFTGGAFEASGTSAKIRQGKNAGVDIPNDFNAQSNVDMQNGSVQPNVNAQTDVTQNDAQSETNRYVQEALTDEMAKLNSAADTKGQNKLTHDDMNKLSDDDMYILDDEMTKKYGEYLKSKGYSEEGIANLLEQSAKNRTSKQSAIDHIMQMQADMGDAGADLNVLTTGMVKNPALNSEIKQRTFFTDKQIGDMTPLQLKGELIKLAPDYTKSMYGKISNREGVDKYVDGLIEETDVKKMRDNLREMQGEVNLYDKQINELNQSLDSDTIIQTIERQEQSNKIEAVPGYKVKPNTYTKIQYNGSVKVGGKIRDVSRKVIQRSDIDFEYIDPDIGISNLELMKKGNNPVGYDGKLINLHHLIQIEVGSLLEMVETTHKLYDKQLHGLVGDNQSFRNNPVLYKQYKNFKKQYWKWRAFEYEKSLGVVNGKK